MKKIWFFGDSWCASGQKGTWTNLLAVKNDCSIAHLGIAGLSLQGTVQDFLDHVDFIQKEDIVVFVYTTIFRWRFQNSCFNYSVWDLDTMNGEHQSITEEQMNAYKKYTMYLSHKKEESLRGACYINYLINYNLPCKAIHIPAFGDFPSDMLSSFVPIKPTTRAANTHNLTELVWDFEEDNGFKPGEVQQDEYSPNHCGEPGTNTDAHGLVAEMAQGLIDR